jgi:hypothetical protein
LTMPRRSLRVTFKESIHEITSSCEREFRGA